ncbi:MAG: hypothetical protein ACK41U_00380 [Paracoccus sp. (in: a-proteobacteria)]|uniref:hypothetical protein n=1 Tax=Paracoccus sp. TaxID=267 RepID=UPI00391DF863
MSRHDPHPQLTEADRDSETRFGLRPVPEGHRTASAYPHRKMVSSHIPPSGKVSPDGRRVWPQPSLAARIIVWGGIAAGVAGVTAAAAIAARKLAGHDDPARSAQAPRQTIAPRFAAIDEDEREEMRRRVRAQARDDSRAAARLRAGASRRRAGSGNAARNLTATANDLSGGLNSVVQSVLGAFEAFQRIAGQARGIVGEFTAAADQIRTLGGERNGPASDPLRPTAPTEAQPRVPPRVDQPGRRI